MTILSFFHLNPHHLRPGPYHVPGLRQRLSYMRVKHIEIAALLTDEIPWYVANGFRAILIGDGVMRTLPDRRHCTEENITRAARLWGESGICDGIEMVDETGQDPKAYMPHAANFVKWWRGACSIPIAWPSLMPRAWSNPALSDYDSPQWVWWSEGITGHGRVEQVKRALANRVPGREVVGHLNLSHWYKKREQGPYYIEGKDRPSHQVLTDKHISCMARAARDAGATRYRIYDFDTPEDAAERNAAPLRTRHQQGTGLWDRRWPGVEMVIRGLLS